MSEQGDESQLVESNCSSRRDLQSEDFAELRNSLVATEEERGVKGLP
jgi:hypothetical protein